MGIFTIFIILAAVAAGLGICGKLFGAIEYKAYAVILWITIIATALFGCIGLFCFDQFSEQNRDIHTMYEDLIIYNDVVQTSDDESTRFAHYERVKEYNEDYKRLEKTSKSKWVGFFVKKDWNADVAPIEFYLFGPVEGIE